MPFSVGGHRFPSPVSLPPKKRSCAPKDPEHRTVSAPVLWVLEENSFCPPWSLRPLPAHIVWPPRARAGARPGEWAEGAARPGSPLGHVARPGLRGGTEGGRVAALASVLPARGPHRAHGQWPLPACHGISPRCGGVDSGPGLGHGGAASRVCIVTQTKAALLFASDLKKTHTQMCNKCNKYIGLTFTR